MAESIVNNLEQTDYQYQENIVPDEGIYDCDCNSFVGFILQALAPEHYAMIPCEPDQPRPRAFEYFLFFTSPGLEAGGGWSVIPSLQDAQRGDIMAWQLTGFQAGDNTGHVFFVAEPARVLDPGVYAVRVYDSAAVAHFDDTRGDGPDQFPNGVGSGFINFQVDDAGAPIAFQFGPSDVFHTYPIAIGRLSRFKLIRS